MAKAHNEVILVMFFSYFIKSFCEESNEETKVGVEYMRIFRNIPTLFEYILDVIDQRVEILEKDDISPFQENINECDNNEVKRETERHCFANCNIPVADKENVFNNGMKRAKRYHGVNKLKRQKNYEALDSEYKTEIFEYGRVNRPNTNLAKKETSDDINERNDKIMELDNIKNEFIKPFNKRLTKINSPKITIAKKQEQQVNMKRVSRNDVQLGKVFAGVDWSQFFLAPEEVEEKAIKTEQMIEDHNKKNRKK